MLAQRCDKMLEEFKTHEDAIVRDAAAAVAELIESSEAGSISKDELTELVNDLVTLDKIDSLADDIDRKVLIEKAFNAIKLIVSKLPL